MRRINELEEALSFNDKWEEVPKEDLWEDGELSDIDVHFKIIDKVLYLGDWKLIRRTEK